MKKKLLLAAAFASLSTTGMLAQTATPAPRKWSGDIELQLQQPATTTGIKGQGSTAAPKGVIITCSDPQTVIDSITAMGYTATAISKGVITADIPIASVPRVATLEQVNYINGTRQFFPTLNNTRTSIGADRVQNGTGLETPFTGKGVIIGVIDQGFEYKHLAFLDKDGKSRVRALWNHAAGQSPTTTIPSTGDYMAANGHATHVTCIAAGSKVEGNDYYGVAPGADIIMVPSSFSDQHILQEAKYISDFAKKEGKPFVINMSFGSQTGPHDGTSAYDQGMNALSCEGGILVAAMGNEGDMRLHVHHRFTQDNETVNVVIDSEKASRTQPYTTLDLWEMSGDGQEHLTIRPFIFTNSTRSKDYKNETFWRQAQIYKEIDPYNHKEHHNFMVPRSIFERPGTKIFFGVEITGNAGDEFHAWVNPDFGEIYTVAGKREYLIGDNKYCAGEGAASIPTAVAVASYNGGRGTFVSAIDNKTYSFGGNLTTQGAISDFSSRGPGLGLEPKPLVAAPGAAVASAVSRYGSDFDAKSVDIVSIIKKGLGPSYYYRVMNGTSMATPAVTGTIALWLEANPKLTYEQVKQIIRQTSRRDQYTGTDSEWTPEAGYGKIDAYEGLKLALQMASQSGINNPMNSETPVTLQTDNEGFRILFNNDESQATLSLYTVNGQEVCRRQLNNIRRGQETVLSKAGLAPGVYIVRISTTASTMSRKMLVK